jgi:cellulose synthase/poly-beta-1,6-N-acetylglucosamine synthase-like glycosyltransferase
MISVVISFYKRLDFLELILLSLDKQSYKDFEIIIAEDDNDPMTVEFLSRVRYLYKYNILHVSHEDKGFRKTRILNMAVKSANGDKIVFIDGDCIPHRHFLKEYNKAISDTVFCYGRRVFLSKKHTDILLNKMSVKKMNTFMAILYGGKSTGAGLYLPFNKNIDKQHRRILGCNWGIMKKNILSVNGFDEDYNRAGVGEDFDIDWRLKKVGLKVRSMKGKAIIFHLFHMANYNPSDTEFVEKLLSDKKLSGNAFCVNGIG